MTKAYAKAKYQEPVEAEPAADEVSEAEPTPLFVWKRGQRWPRVQFHELWEYRELLYFLVWREVKVRYKQTALGVMWVILQPVLTMAVFSLFFGVLAGVPSDGIPYPLFAFAGLLPWQLFANALSGSGNSLVMNSSLITKVYFPRLFIPFSAVLVGLVDFVFALGAMMTLMLAYGIVPTHRIMAIPIFLALAVGTALAVGLWLSSLSVRYRDVPFIVPFLTQLWLFATPIAYPSSVVPEPWRAVYGINPMVGVVDGFRWALFGLEGGLGASTLVSATVSAALLVGGIAYFKRSERTFADEV